VLYDVIGILADDGRELDRLVADEQVVVLALARDLRPALELNALSRGAVGVISQKVTARDLARAVEAAGRGELARSPSRRKNGLAYVGQQLGLTRRESDVVGLIVRGRSNAQIAEELALSANSVKTYIRNAYHKIRVRNRSEATAWGVRNGYTTETDRRPGRLVPAAKELPEVIGVGYRPPGPGPRSR
jgi:DNA-binding NarL/FixJ family response regulator